MQRKLSEPSQPLLWKSSKLLSAHLFNEVQLPDMKACSGLLFRWQSCAVLVWCWDSGSAFFCWGYYRSAGVCFPSSHSDCYRWQHYRECRHWFWLCKYLFLLIQPRCPATDEHIFFSMWYRYIILYYLTKFSSISRVCVCTCVWEGVCG